MKNSLLYRVSRKVYKGEIIPPESGNFTSDQNLFNYQAKVLKQLAERESFVGIGRGCTYVLKDIPNVLRVFIYASRECCIHRESLRQGISEKDAARHVKKMDKFRSEYHKYHTGLEWHDPYNYDLCLNTELMTYEQCAKIIEYQMFVRFGIEMPTA